MSKSCVVSHSHTHVLTSHTTRYSSEAEVPFLNIRYINTTESKSFSKMIIIFGERERETKREREREWEWKRKISFPCLHPSVWQESSPSEIFQSFWVEVFRGKQRASDKVSLLFIFLHSQTVATTTTTATTKRVSKGKPSLGWGALVRVHPFVSAGLGMFCGSPPVPPKDAASRSQGGFFLAIASVARFLDFGNPLQCAWLSHSGHRDKQERFS